ncbi:MAG: aspartate-semialdehyde dehydrogenase, partial [Planctomycetota bacterium]
VGATGAVGLEALALLIELGVRPERIIACASKRSEGDTINAGGQEFVVQSADAAARADAAVLATPAEVSRALVPELAAQGVRVSDNSWAFRQQAPLIIPEINGREVTGLLDLVVSTPNCTTTIALVGLHGLLHAFDWDTLEIVSYQAVSGAGIGAMRALLDETERVVAGEQPAPQWLDHAVAFNVFPHESAMDDASGQCEEELKFAREASRILGTDRGAFAATCMRVPVLRSHTVVARLSISEVVRASDVAEIVGATAGVRLVSGQATSIDAAGRCDVLADRIRVQPDRVRGGSVIWMMIAGDQLLKGAAWNAIQNAGLLLRA